jgi:UDP-GlcNAc:undecaprenyl-phosphate/decaprenyl-phosphate GlcNAc-1-phosphate transferase
MDNTLQFIPALVVGFTASLGLTPLSRQIAMRFGVVDKPNQRKIHQDHKPLMGGLAIYAAFTIAVLLFSPPSFLKELGSVLGGAALLALVGLIDDRYNLSARVRLIPMTAAALGLIISGVYLRFFNVPVLDYALTIVWVVAMINAMNFQDNMDGLSSGLAAISAFTFLLIALSQQLSLVSLLAAALLGSAVGFLAYNFNPSSTFMGDMGALVIGFVLATLAIKIGFWEQAFDAHWSVPLLALAVPIFDIVLVVFTRLAEGRSPMQGGKDHTSHRLMSLGLSQRSALLVLYIVAVSFGFIALVMTALPTNEVWMLNAACTLIVAGMYIFMILIRQRVQLKKASVPVATPTQTS